MADPRTKQLSIIDGSGAIAPAGSFITSGPKVDWQKELLPRVVGGRLTIDDGGLSPTISGELFNKTEVFYVPYVGTSISLYDGSEWIMHDFFPYLSKSINSLDFYGDPIDPGTSYDVYIALQNGLPTLELEPWTSVGINADTRTVSPVYFQGVLVKGNDDTRRYVGMIRTTSTTAGGMLEDSYDHLFVWNALNQVNRVAIKSETTNDLTFTANQFGVDWHLIPGSTLGFIEFINGVETKCRCDATAGAKTTGGRRNGVIFGAALDGGGGGGGGSRDLPYGGSFAAMWSWIDDYRAANYHRFKLSISSTVFDNSIVWAPDGPDSGPNIARPGMTVVIAG